MKMVEKMDPGMLATCGINCTVCYVHLKKKKPCPGCNRQEEDKPQSCRKCAIKECAAARGLSFCYACSAFPCARMKRLDKSYRQRYRVSLVENAKRLESIGAEPYLAEEQVRWACTACGGIISLHDRICSECGKKI